MKHNTKVYDTDTLVIDKDSVLFFKCCDCELRHLFIFDVKKDKIHIRVIKDDLATHILRKIKRGK